MDSYLRSPMSFHGTFCQGMSMEEKTNCTINKHIYIFTVHRVHLMCTSNITTLSPPAPPSDHKCMKILKTIIKTNNYGSLMLAFLICKGEGSLHWHFPETEQHFPWLCSMLYCRVSYTGSYKSNQENVYISVI